MMPTNHYLLFQLAQLFIRGNSRYCFPKRWNWQICHAHRAFRHPVCTFRGKLRTFPTVKSKTIGFLLHRTQKYSPVPFWRIPHELLPEKELQSGHYAAYSRAAGTCYPTGCTCFHYKRFENCWKRFAERLLVLHTVIPHHALVERGKDKTVRNAKSLKRSIGTVIANVPNCILRSRIVYIDTTGFLFVVW